MHEIEKQVISKLVDEASKRGYTMSVFDGEEWTVTKSTNKAEILGSLGTVDEDTLYFRDRDGNKVGWVYLVYGNEPYYVISDHSSSPEMSDLMQEVWELVDELEAVHG